jgi:neutral ceramidase
MAGLKASARQVDLDPPSGGWLSGFAARVEPSTGTHDPLLASAVLLDDGNERFAIVSCDLVGFTSLAVAQMRDRIEAATGGSIPGSHVLIACTHTHSGPASLPFRGVMGYVDRRWLSEAKRRIVDLVAGLTADLAPARIAHGFEVVTGIGFNRQDGSRPIDEQLDVVAVEGENGACIATLACYATHAVVLGPRNLLYSADYPGEVARGLAAARGGIGIFLAGACGDADPALNRDRGWGTGTSDDVRRIGERLTTAAVAALRGAERRGDCSIRVSGRVLDIPLDPLPSPTALDVLVKGFEADRRKALAERDRAEELVADAMLDWASEVKCALRGGAAPRTIPAELFVAALNDLRFIGVPFEAYSDIGRAVRSGIRPLHSVFVGYANGLYGYCASRWAKDQGGYGPDEACRWFPGQLAPVGAGADELIVADAVRLATGRAGSR